MEKVIVITGPTSIGKTDLSIQIAKKYNGEIINCDASGFCRGLNVGTAKITTEQMKGVKHHLIDIIDPGEDYSVKEYQHDARMLIHQIHLNNKIPFMVGGSGLYISSTIYDYHFNNTPTIDESKYADYSNSQLHKLLEEVDYQSSLVIHENNRRRVIRAIELARNDNAISQNKDGKIPVFDALVICLNCERELLYDRINKRFEVMINDGWIEECRNLIAQNVNLDNIKDIGYKEIKQFINDEISYEQMSEEVKKKTRNYAKRQMTWFRNKLECHFVNMDYNDLEQTFNQIDILISEFLK